MKDLDQTCGGLLPLIPGLEASPAVYDDRDSSWLTREELRNASVDLAKTIASERKRLVFLLCGVNSETVIGLLAAAAAGHATALIDPALPEHLMTGLLESYQPELILGPSGSAETIPYAMNDKATVGSAPFRARVVESIARETDPSFPPIDPALQLLLSTSGTTGSQKYVRLSRDAVVANARQIARGAGDRRTERRHRPSAPALFLRTFRRHVASDVRRPAVSHKQLDHIAELLVEDRKRRRIALPWRPVSLCRARPPRRGPRANSVKTFTQAGGALDLRVQTKIRDWATQRGGQFFVMYGQTEAAPRMATLQHADHARKAGSVGVALDGGRFSIVDESGAPRRPTWSGRLSTKGPTSCRATLCPGPTSARATR